MNSKKKMILIITATCVVILSLGLGLGLGLKTDSDSNSPTSSGSEGKDNLQYTTSNGITVSGTDVQNGKTMIGQTEYSITKNEEDLYLSIPGSTYALSGRELGVKGMFGNPGSRKYTENNNNKGEGKDNFYDLSHLLPTFGRLVVRIPNDGKIYGGYNDNLDQTGYMMFSKLAAFYPDGYQIGDFSENDGRGGINMLRLEQLKTLQTANDLTAENVDSVINGATATTKFGPFLFSDNNKTYVRLATNPTPSWPHDIGYAPATPDIAVSTWPDASANKEYWWDHSANYGWDGVFPRDRDYPFRISEFVNQDGTPYTITLRKDENTLAGAAVDVPLNKLYMPLTFVQGRYQHPVLGLIQPNITGHVEFSYSIEDENGTQPTFQVNDDGSLTLPTLLLPLQKSNN